MAHPVEVCFLQEDGRPGETFSCLPKDISLTGLGLYLPNATANAPLRVTLTTPNHTEPLSLRGTCVRVQQCGEGWYEVGILFE